LSNSSEGGPVGIFKCGSRKEKYLGSVRYTWVSEKITNKRKILRRSGDGEKGRYLTIEAKWGVGKRADIYLEVRKRRGAYIL
jgi:hypothetical protein